MMARGLSRRGVLGGAAAPVPAASVAAFPALAGIGNPDAQLIGWCSAFNAGRARIEAAYRAAPDDGWDEVDAVADRIEGELAPLLNLICASSPTTLEGVRAVAGSLLRSMADVDPLRGDDRAGTDEDRLRVALLRGLLVGGAA